MLSLRFLVGLLALLALSACDILPRGAALQKEVVAAGEDGTSNFAVYPVNSETLPQIADWPRANGKYYGWLKHSHGSDTARIVVGDKIAISIWDSDENTLLAGPGQKVVDLREATVGSDGRIFVPYIDKVKVSGLTADSARSRIQGQLRGLIPSAQVQLNVTSGTGSVFNLVSGVAKPGQYPLENSNVTILDGISVGGGVSAGLRNPQVRLQRGHKVYGTSVSRLFETPKMNAPMRGGDRLIIEADDRYFLSLGAAGSEKLHEFSKDKITALDAISIMGGVAEARGTPKGLLILRHYPQSAVGKGPAHHHVVFVLDLTNADGLFAARSFNIQTEDLVYVSESPVTAAQTIFGLVGSVFGLAGAASGL